MHLGNIYTALVSWLSVRRSGGKWILRIEDLDPQRSRMEYARQIEDDLHWLGLEWDEGGIGGRGPSGPYCQSLRHHLYEEALKRLETKGLTYPCHCRRADILASRAPHRTDGSVVYPGHCRPASCPPFPADMDFSGCSTRIYVPDREISFNDRVYGPQTFNPARECGDFILRRADGAWAYQLAVVVDDALMGVTEVVRGVDLLDSSARQIYLYDLLGYKVPEFAHLPLICNEEGQRLSKRDHSMSMEVIRGTMSRPELLRRLAGMANMKIPAGVPVGKPADLIPYFSFGNFSSAPQA